MNSKLKIIESENIDIEVNRTVDSIKSSYRKSLKELLLTAKKLSEAYKDKSFRKVRAKLIEDKIMASSTISTFIKIGECELFYDERYEELLPNSYTSLYELAKLNREKLISALEQKDISADMTVKEVKEFVSNIENDMAVNEDINNKEVMLASDEKCYTHFIDLPEVVFDENKDSIDEINSKYSFLKICRGEK